MINIYLNFDGNCREVFEYYRSVFGGEFAIMQTFRNGPPDMGMPVADDELDNVMHVSFPIGESVLMGSDTPSGFGMPHAPGNNFSISVSPESREEADRLFARLSDGGEVGMPMADMFWGSYFGTCVDKFGIPWLIDCEQS